MNGMNPYSMSEIELPAFAQSALTQTQIVDVATALVGLPYDEKATFVEWGEDGAPRGYCNCWGLLLVVCQRLGLIGPKFWRALQFQIARRGVAQTLRRLLSREMHEVAAGDEQAGDVLLFRWRGDGIWWNSEEEAVESAFHHIGILTSLEPRPTGTIVHAVETAADLSGRVLQSNLAPHDYVQLHSVWRFPQLVVIGDG